MVPSTQFLSAFSMDTSVGLPRTKPKETALDIVFSAKIALTPIRLAQDITKTGSEILIDQSDVNKRPRKLTPNECRRLQGFPDGFNVNVVSDAQVYRQFGNSVSVPVIEAIAAEMLPYLTKS